MVSRFEQFQSQITKVGPFGLETLWKHATKTSGDADNETAIERKNNTLCPGEVLPLRFANLALFEKKIIEDQCLFLVKTYILKKTMAVISAHNFQRCAYE